MKYIPAQISSLYWLYTLQSLNFFKYFLRYKNVLSFTGSFLWVVFLLLYIWCGEGTFGFRHWCATIRSGGFSTISEASLDKLHRSALSGQMMFVCGLDRRWVILYKNSPSHAQMQNCQAQHKYRGNLIRLEYLLVVKAILLMKRELVIVMIAQLCVSFRLTLISQRGFVSLLIDAPINWLISLIPLIRTDLIQQSE